MPKRTDLKSVLVIGSGPIVIGQAAEFDYSGTQALRVLKEEGLRVILVNSNPATIMTDPEFADATYIEPITPEVVEKIIAKERPDARPAHPGRPDRTQHRDRAGQERRAGEVQRRADRRQHRRDRARRGPRKVQGRRGALRRRIGPQPHHPHHRRGPRRRRGPRLPDGGPALLHHGRPRLRPGLRRERPPPDRRPGPAVQPHQPRCCSKRASSAGRNTSSR